MLNKNPLECLKEGAGLIITYHLLRVWRLLERSGLYGVSDSSRSAEVCVLAVNTLQPLSAAVAANEDAKPAW